MHLNWKERIAHQPEFADFDNWPKVYPHELLEEKRKGFIRNEKVVVFRLAGKKIKYVAKECGVSNGRVTQIMNRALAGDAATPPALTCALIPGTQVKSGDRISPLSCKTKPKGNRGAYGYLLRNVPTFEDHLKKYVESNMGNRRTGQNLTAEDFHKEGMRFLVEVGHDRMQYPFDQDTFGRESFRKHFIELKANLKLQKIKPRPTITQKKPIGRPYQEVQFDSQVLDVYTSIEEEVNGKSNFHRLVRPSLFIAVDVATGVLLSYHLCLARDASSEDLLALLEKIHRPWKPLNLKTNGLKYDQGACMPSSLGDIYQNAGIGMIRADNALCHMSLALRGFICEKLNASLNFGLPATPRTRSKVESIFIFINRITHRFASTAGSHHKDPIKESLANSKKPPVLTIAALNEVLSVAITQYNVTPQERLGAKSPLFVLQNLMANQLFRVSYLNLHIPANPFSQRKKAIVRWNEKDGQRPHINFEGQPFRGDCLVRASLVKMEVIVEYDIRDIRSLRVFKNDGTYIGELLAPRSWQLYPLSLRTKKKIAKDAKRLRLDMKDPLGSYFANLSKLKNNPKAALELVRVYQEIVGNDSDEILKLKSNIKPDVEPSEHLAKEKASHISAWTPRLVNGGRK